MTGVTKAVVYTILSGMMHVKYPLFLSFFYWFIYIMHFKIAHFIGGFSIYINLKLLIYLFIIYF